MWLLRWGPSRATCLHERRHPLELGRFVDRLLEPGGEVVVVDPGRGQQGRLGRTLADLGLQCTPRREPIGGVTILRYSA